ncbi:DUF4054 domain-containing protein [Komagataeibacter sp. FNDCF1]|uniref:DUF4054 domain-containing protein n=1 Tax=Komagataeibacter sp. FNDCF1 TaxID=2878681 RepID=UPI001E43DE8C|nr:DUF4054 domain-containing protein [Komagataeibacter sp. FNDCF1]MCE2563375.1 DUF4054 domain-containing protein [Komagataeibacter sp. FNDCF1]
MNASDFLTLFPEFSDTTRYPTATITMWLTVAAQFVDQRRWGDSYNLGLSLFVAHELVLGQQAAIASAAGSVPGVTTGVVASKSVGPLSKSYDTSISKYDDAGFWNLSSYGQRYWYFMGLFGTGGHQF